MTRNLNDRVEAIVEVKNPQHKNRLLDILNRALSDQRSAWILHPDGQHVQRVPSVPHNKRGFQEQLMAWAQQHTA